MLLDLSAQGEPPSLCISVSRDDPTGVRRNLIRFSPTWGGEAIAYQYEAVPGLLTIRTEHGTMEICFESEDDVLRFRSTNGLGAAFFIEFFMHELFVDRLDGSVEVGFTSMGEFLFEVIKGRQSHDNTWIGPKMCATPTTILWTPEAGEMEGYLFWNTEYVEKKNLTDFSVCVAENQQRFARWLRMLPPPVYGFEDIWRQAGYLVWISELRPLWRLKEAALYMSRCGEDQRASAWLQSFGAMAFRRDQTLAFDLLFSFFALQDPSGTVPGTADDRRIDYAVPKSPVQGLALLWMMDRIGAEAVDAAQCRRLYAPLCRWVAWWKEYRFGSNGLAYHNHAGETLFDTASMFCGVPLQTPDLQTFLILCMEACGHLAERLGDPEAARLHLAEADALTEKLLALLWDGEGFVSMAADGRKQIETAPVPACIPILLGKRLPQEITEKLAERLEVSRAPFTDGAPCAAAELMFTIGLLRCGKTAPARKAAKRWLDRCLREGIPSGAEEQGPGSAAALGGIVFFILSDLLNDLPEE